MDTIDGGQENDYLDSQLGSLKNGVKINNYHSAQSVNDWWNDRGYSNPPYSKETLVQDITLTKDFTFVRVYDGINTRLEGGWVMRVEDIKGLSPKEIQIKYALPYEPIYVGEVRLKEGDSIRLGEAAPNFGFKGGGMQIDLKQQFIGEFKELGEINNWR